MSSPRTPNMNRSSSSNSAGRRVSFTGRALTPAHPPSVEQPTSTQPPPQVRSRSRSRGWRHVRRPSGERWIEYLDEDGARVLRYQMPYSSNQIMNPATSTPTPRSPNQHHQTQDRRSPPSECYTSPLMPSPASPILPAHSLEDDLYQHLKSFPPPAHLQDQPRAAIIWRWANWLVDAQGVDKENAQILAESHVESRWQDTEVGVQDAEYSIQPDHEDIRAPWTQWEYDAPTSHPGEQGNQANATRTQSVQLSAAQLNATPTTDTGYTPSTSPARPHQRHPDPTFNPDYTANPAHVLWEIPGNNSAADEPIATVWEQITYRPDATAYQVPGSVPHEPHHVPVYELATHLTNAIKAALKASPNATGPDLYLDARFRVPVPVARVIASGAIEGNAANILPTLTSVNAFVPVAAHIAKSPQAKGDQGTKDTRETPLRSNPWPTRTDSLRSTGRSKSKTRHKTPEEIAKEEEEEWNEVRTPKPHWPY